MKHLVAGQEGWLPVKLDKLVVKRVFDGMSYESWARRKRRAGAWKDQRSVFLVGFGGPPPLSSHPPPRKNQQPLGTPPPPPLSVVPGLGTP